MAHAASIYDKYMVSQKLKSRGFSHDQAEGIAEALASVDLSELATKNDLKSELKDLELRLEKSLHRQTWGLIGVMFAQGAFIVAILQLLR